MKNRGMTLVEMVTALALLSFILVVVFTVYTTCLRSWRRVEARSSLARGVSRTIRNLHSELEFANFATLETDPTSIGYLHPSPASGTAYFDSDRNPVWQGYRFLYLDTENSELRRRDFAFSGGLPTPLSDQHGSLVALKTGGQVVLKNLVSFQPTPLSSQRLSILLEAEQPARMGQAPLRFQLTSVIEIHN